MRQVSIWWVQGDKCVEATYHQVCCWDLHHKCKADIIGVCVLGSTSEWRSLRASPRTSLCSRCLPSMRLGKPGTYLETGSDFLQSDSKGNNSRWMCVEMFFPKTRNYFTIHHMRQWSMKVLSAEILFLFELAFWSPLMSGPALSPNSDSSLWDKYFSGWKADGMSLFAKGGNQMVVPHGAFPSTPAQKGYPKKDRRTGKQ